MGCDRRHQHNGIHAHHPELIPGAVRPHRWVADELAARVGGTIGAAGMMELLLLEASIRLTLQRAANERVADRVAYLRDHVLHLPATELERLRRVADQRGHRVDTTHPPTHLRLAFARSLELADPSVTMTLEEAATVDSEVLGRP
jgi:hypothetical protein